MLIFDTPGPAAKPGLLLQLCQLLSRALLARGILWWTFTCGHFQLLHAKIRDLVTSYHKPFFHTMVCDGEEKISNFFFSITNHRVKKGLALLFLPVLFCKKKDLNICYNQVIA